MTTRILATMLFLIPMVVFAGKADVVNVQIQTVAVGQYTFNVTVKHADAGWDHYANRWEILGLNGDILATRVLHHPHVDEQPFTRSLRNVTLASGLQKVIVRAHDSVHGYGGKTVTVAIP